MAASYNYRLDYQLTHDIDWFFKIKEVPFHVASNGGLIPKMILSQENFDIQTEVYSIQQNDNVEIVVREDDVKQHALANVPVNDIQEALESYTKTFKAMAKKGFVSLDRLSDDRYMVVAYPKDLKKDYGAQYLLQNLKENALSVGQIVNWKQCEGIEI